MEGDTVRSGFFFFFCLFWISWDAVWLEEMVRKSLYACGEEAGGREEELERVGPFWSWAFPSLLCVLLTIHEEVLKS